MENQVKLYIDGTSQGAPGPGAYAIIAVRGKERRISTGIADDTTASRMDLMAAVEAVTCIGEDEEGLILTDSASIVEAFRENRMPEWHARNWRSSRGKVQNSDLWIMMSRQAEGKNFKVKYIKATDKDENNQLVHQIANSMLDKTKSLKGNQDSTINVTNIGHSLKKTLLTMTSFEPQEDESVLIKTGIRTADGDRIGVKIDCKDGKYVVDDMAQTARILASNPKTRSEGPHPMSLIVDESVDAEWDPNSMAISIRIEDADDVGRALLSLAIAIRIASLFSESLKAE